MSLIFLYTLLYILHIKGEYEEHIPQSSHFIAIAAPLTKVIYSSNDISNVTFISQGCCTNLVSSEEIIKEKNDVISS